MGSVGLNKTPPLINLYDRRFCAIGQFLECAADALYATVHCDAAEQFWWKGVQDLAGAKRFRGATPGKTTNMQRRQHSRLTT